MLPVLLKQAEYAIIIIPSIVKTAPVARFKVLGSALLANLAAILAHSNVDRTQKTRIEISGIPPITK